MRLRATKQAVVSSTSQAITPAPSLDLRFAANKSLVDAVTGQSLVTFTRSSGGTYVDSAGVLRSAAVNLFLQSENFETTWLSNGLLAFGSGSITNAIVAPNETTTADLIIENTATSQHNVNQSVTIIGQKTFSVFAKQGPGTRLLRLVDFNSTDGAQGETFFNLSTGTVVSGTGSITAFPNGWYRCSITTTTTVASTYFISISSAAPVFSYTGDGTSGFYIWGAQLQTGSVATEYIPTTATINSAPRFDHNPTTGESLGLLVEEQRTNSIRNNTMVGAVAGNPGTLPTDWSTFSSLTGLTSQVVGTGTENGITYLDFRLSGTPSAAGAYFLNFESTTQVAASSGQAWTSSAYYKLQAGSLIGVTSVQNGVSARDAVGANLSSFFATFVPTFSALNTQRVTSTITSNPASTAFETQFLRLNLSGVAIDITLRIGLPQLEQGAFATSVIPTTTTTTTRSADVVSISGTNFSSWYRQDEGTFAADAFREFAVPSNAFPVVIDCRTGSADINQLSYVTETVAGQFVQVGGVTQSELYLVITPSGTRRRKLVSAYASNNFGACVNGSVPLTDTNGSVPTTLQSMFLGSAAAGAAQFLNGTIRRLSYFPRRLANHILQRITQPTAATAWTPAQLGSALALWLDADDASTITLNGSNVSQWSDKSGKGKHAVQATASLQPQYLATAFNNKPTLKFDATDDVFFIENTSANASGDFFIGAAFNFVTTAGTWLMIAGFRPAVATPASGQPILQRMEGFSRIGYHHTDIAATSVDVAVTTLTGNKIATLGRTGGTAGNGGTATVTVTGASGNYLSTGTQTWTSTAGTNFQIAGRQQSATAFSEKNISELILCNRNLTTLERQQYEGYLAHKWGLVADLPADHPFKLTPPTV